jgi:hypothetical protein
MLVTLCALVLLGIAGPSALADQASFDCQLKQLGLDFAQSLQPISIARLPSGRIPCVGFGFGFGLSLTNDEVPPASARTHGLCSVLHCCVDA